MTALIAIKNDSCVALASDSALSLGDGNQFKVYNYDCKMFQLSEMHPVGIMIYGSPCLVGIDIETLIKLYRKELKGKLLDSLNDYVKGFITFLKKNKNLFFTQKKMEEKEKVDIVRYLKENVFQLLFDETSGREKPVDPTENLFIKILDDLDKKLDNINTLPRAFDCPAILNDLKKISALVDRLVPENCESAITDKSRRRIKSIANKAFSKKCCMGECGGLVFAGFGEKEMHPQIRNIEIYRVIKPATGRDAIILTGAVES